MWFPYSGPSMAHHHPEANPQASQVVCTACPPMLFQPHLRPLTLCLLGYSSTDGSLPPHLPSVPQLRAFARAVPSYTILLLRYLHGSLLQFIKVSAPRPVLRTLFADRLSEITISLCCISLPNLPHFLRHHIIHLFIHLLSVFCNTLWSVLHTPTPRSMLAEIIHNRELPLLSFSHSPPSLTTP